MSPLGPRRRDTIYELRVTHATIEKLAAHGISVDETEELVDNRYVIRRNTGRRRRSRHKLETRRIVTGNTNGGRTLTLIVERTKNPTTWLIITGWPSTRGERRRIKD